MQNLVALLEVIWLVYQIIELILVSDNIIFFVLPRLQIIQFEEANELKIK